MKAKNDVVMGEKKCKKCGDPIRSTSKYKYCDNCRREKAKAQRDVGGAALGLAVMALSCVPIIKHFVKKD
jgi:ribosomal protein S14